MYVKITLSNKMGIETGYHPTPKDRSHLLKYMSKSQEELPKRSMQDSFIAGLIPLSTDKKLQDKYVSFLGHVRIGRLLEDMDIFAGKDRWDSALNSIYSKAKKEHNLLIRRSKRSYYEGRMVRSGNALKSAWSLVSELSNKCKRVENTHIVIDSNNLLIRRSKRSYYEGRMVRSGNALKSAWSLVSELSNKCKRVENTHIVIDSVDIRDPLKVAEALNDFFIDEPNNIIGKIDGADSCRVSGEFSTPYCIDSLFLTPFVETEMANILTSKLKNKSSSGPDDIPMHILKKLISTWFKCNSLYFNTEKTQVVRFRNRQKNCLPLNLVDQGSHILPFSKEVKFLGLTMDECLNWRAHCVQLISRLNSFCHLLRSLRGVLSDQMLLMIYHAHVSSRLRYVFVAYKHILNPKIPNETEFPYTLVTALVDNIVFTDYTTKLPIR
ncbi:hypothetical protein NQ315_003632 [Exocentrus adspersus]|uniref:Uncharacterized protein n=1 Tax=Exocentrus adspersus TaxID=1586481 RepID=A0AAV8VC20_9CUCU|nr:hypothetical protein NQ315_003632 [Exocentrus adspersus]